VGWTSSVVWSLARSPSVDGTQRPRLIRVDRRSTRPPRSGSQGPQEFSVPSRVWVHGSLRTGQRESLRTAATDGDPAEERRRPVVPGSSGPRPTMGLIPSDGLQATGERPSSSAVRLLWRQGILGRTLAGRHSMPWAPFRGSVPVRRLREIGQFRGRGPTAPFGL
jgi:hypothetical protein